jgi:hypothetical protein
MALLVQKSDLNTSAFTNNNTALAGGINIRTDAISVVGQAIAAAIAAVNGDKFLTSLASYNAVTNTMVFNMSDGSTVSVDMALLVNDAVVTAIASLRGANGVAARDNAGALIGYFVAP